MHEFNKESIVEQRENKETANNVLYWTNKKMKQWLNQIDLQVLYSPVNKPVLTTHIVYTNIHNTDMYVTHIYILMMFMLSLIICYHIGVF